MVLVRAAMGTLVGLMLAGCAGEQFSLGSSASGPQTKELSVPGRWTLAAPNAPSCGLDFGGGPGAREGTVRADGGCPGKFYMSRRWTMDGGSLTIIDTEEQPLAQLSFKGDHFEGESAAGMPITLSQ